MTMVLHYISEQRIKHKQWKLLNIGEGAEVGFCEQIGETNIY